MAVAPLAKDAARATSPLHGAVAPLHRVARAAHPHPKPQPAIKRPTVHLHVHGVSAEDIAAILARHQDGPARGRARGPARPQVVRGADITPILLGYIRRLPGLYLAFRSAALP